MQLIGIALAINTFVFTMSALKKLKDLLSSDGHGMMGPGRAYPAWLLPVALVHEVVMVVLLHVDRPLGVLACCAFIGGVLHATGSSGGPIEKVGPAGAIPAVLVALCTLVLAGAGTEPAGPVSRLLGISMLDPFQLVPTGVAVAFCGCGVANRKVKTK